MIDYFNGAHNAAEEHSRDCGASTLGECIQDDARHYGAEHPDVEWIPNDFDSYTLNPYYIGIPQPYPEDRNTIGDEFPWQVTQLTWDVREAIKYYKDIVRVRWYNAKKDDGVQP